MSVQSFFSFLSQHSLWIVIYFVAIFGLSLLISQRQKKVTTPLNAQILSLFVFMVCIPGILAAIVVFYSLFFVHINLLEVNVVIYFLPIVMMILTLFVIAKNVNLNGLPGFNRLSGLMTLLTFTGFILLLLYKLRFMVGFFASIQSLLIFGVVLYFIFKSALGKLRGNK
jgi:hypothetical protein